MSTTYWEQIPDELVNNTQGLRLRIGKKVRRREHASSKKVLILRMHSTVQSVLWWTASSESSDTIDGQQ